MSKNYTADQIRLKIVDLLSGTSDPSAGGGVAAQIASFYLRQNAGVGSAWLKTGAANTAWAQLTQSFAWFSVKDYGALGDGATDDRVAIQAAIDACVTAGGGRVYFPAGTYVCSKNGTTSFTISGANGVYLCGAGPSSIIKQSGNAASATWTLFQVTNSTNIRFSDLTLDGSGVTNPTTNGHLVRVGDGAMAITNIQFFRCHFQGMAAGSGDAIQFFGATALVTRAWVTDCVFNGIGRYGVNIAGGVQFAWIVNNFMTNCIREIVIVAALATIADSIVITGNELLHTGTDRLAMQLSGDATNFLSNSPIAQNLIIGGFVETTNLSRCTIYGNIQTSGAFASALAAWRNVGRIQDTTFSGNFIDRSAGATAGVCISFEGSGGVGAARVRVGHTTMINEIAGGGFVFLSDCTQLSVGSCMCRNTTSAGASVAYGVEIQSIAIVVDDVMVHAMNMSAAAGSFAAGVRFVSNGVNFGNAIIASNILDTTDYGWRVDKITGNFTGRYMWSGNNMNASVGDINQVGAPGIIPNIGWNAGPFSPGLTQGAGSPEGVVVARIGSMFSRTDGGQATTIYYKESGIGNTGWVAIGGSVLVFGFGTTTVVATAVFAGYGYITVPTATEIQFAVTRPGTIRNLRVRIAGAGTDAVNAVYTVRKNGVDTALTVTISNTSVGGVNDLAHSFTVVAGDLISLSCTKAGAVTAGQTNVVAAMELV